MNNIKKVFSKIILLSLILIILGISIAKIGFARIEYGITNADIPDLTSLGDINLGTPEQEALYNHLGKPFGKTEGDTTTVSEDTTSTNIDTSSYNYITTKCINDFMKYLNEKSDTVTGLVALRNFSSVFCLKHGQALRGWNGYVKTNHSGNKKVNQYISLSSNETTMPLESIEDIEYVPSWNETDRKIEDYLEKNPPDSNGEIRKQKVQSHMRYFLTEMTDLYDITTDYGEYDTNIFAYSSAFSNKSKVLHNDGNNLAQLAIWGVVGNPAVGEPDIGASTPVDGETYIDDTGLDQTLISNTTLITDSELWNAGAALDEYESWLTQNVSGSDADKHDAAVEGTDPDLLNRPSVEINAASGADEYVENSEGEKVGTVEDATGTTLQKIGGKYYYKIGPFTMSDYALASAKDVNKDGTTENYIEKYSGKELDVYKDMLGGIIDGSITFKNDSGGVTSTVEFSTNPDAGAQIVYTDMLGNSTNTDLTLRDGSYVRTPRTSDDEPYVFPYPNSTFYILINKDTCGADATKLAEFSFVYRQTKAYGEGWVVHSRFTQTAWTIDEEEIGCSGENSYECEDCEHDNLSQLGSNWGDNTGTQQHVWYCGGTGYCYYGTSGEHRHCSSYTGCHSCSGHSCPGHSCPGNHPGGTCTCTLAEGESCKTTHYYNCGSLHYCGNLHYCGWATRIRCSHGYQYGQHYFANGQNPNVTGTYDTDYCSGRTVCHDHGHNNCAKGHWNSTADPTVVTGQPLLVIHDAQVEVIKTEIKSTIDIRLTTDVSIKKYIYDVQHVESDVLTNSGYDSTLTPEEGQARKELSEADKESNPVYVEYGDKIIYHIDLINEQAQDVLVKIRDNLPSNCQVLNINVGGTNIGYTSVIDGYFSTDWIPVTGNTTTSTVIEVLVKEKVNVSDTAWENSATIITRNAGHTEYPSKDAISIDYMRVDDESCPGPVVNLAELAGKTIESSDWFKLNDYNANIDKFIIAYDDKMTRSNNNNPENAHKMQITNEENVSTLLVDDSKEGSKEYFTRYTYTEQDKKDHPLSVEKGEFITYSILVSNDSVTEGLKKATQVRPSKIIDKLQIGLYVSQQATGILYDSEGNVVTRYDSFGTMPVTVSKVGVSDGYTTYKLEMNEDVILNPGEYIVFTMKVGIEESNMYLYDLENNASLTTLTNINHKQGEDPLGPYDRIIRDLDDDIDVNNGVETSSEFVKMKDLVISGRVWLDKDKDGQMDLESDKTFDDGSIDVDTKPSSKISYTKSAYEKAMQNIVVKLYQDVEKDGNDENDILVRTTKTDENGIYTFGRDSSLTWYNGKYSITGTSGSLVTLESDQRIPKADNKDTNKNYTSDSKYIDYYVEFEYDGVLYKSTELYAGTSNLRSYGQMEKYCIECDRSMGSMSTCYYCSHTCNNCHRPIAGMYYCYHCGYYNAFGYYEKYYTDSNAKEFTVDRENFNKNYEYISYDVAYGCSDANDKLANLTDKTTLEFNKTNHNSYLRIDPSRVMTSRSFVTSTQTTNYLWLYDFVETNPTRPETEYLKYINLGLEEREDLDLALTKDVYEVKTTINGEEVSYNYDQLEAEGPNAINSEMNSSGKKYLQNYIIKEPYGLTLYESDYKYRFEEYKNEAVRNHKTAGSELNIEVTYKITVDSKAISFDKRVDQIYNDYEDIELDARIHEILDLYDENFKEISFNDDGSMKTDASNIVTIKEKDTKIIGEETVDTLKDKDIVIGEAWYYTDNDTTKEPQYLTLTNKSKYYSDTEKANDFAGYNTVYISGMDDIYVEEGEKLDIYVKYVIDKADTETLKRVLKIEDKIEGVGQINAYSTWYHNSKKPASIVDCDSNAGNIGIKNDDKELVDSLNVTTYYEDIAYKADIDINVDDTPPPPPPDIPEQPKLERKLTGKVWDDARSTIPASGDSQYMGNGMYKGTSDTAKTEAKLNETVPINYKSGVTEEHDILVRSVKAEYIEIIPIIGADENVRYYEEKLDGSAWNAVQNTRTDTNGEYTLSGYIPGYYIVRFTYGDGAEKTITEKTPLAVDTQDMLVFNGQDYKSTKYTGEADTLTDYNSILMKMQNTNRSDARDDEVRRLETIAYSEVMVNRIAEILKGITNGTTLTPNNKEKNKAGQLNELVENTSMYADTVKFYVKPEKLSKLTDTDNGEFNVITTYAGLIKNSNTILYKEVEDIEFTDTSTSARTFKIKNIDLGIEYRPESQISLNKRIVKITLTPSDKQKDIVELVFNSVGEGDERKNILDEANSKGFENTKFISNKYTTLSEYRLTSEKPGLQGRVWIEMDEEILQGCELEIEYEFVATNESEVDRINKNLEELRYKENAKAKGYETLFYSDDPSNKNYRGARTAANILKNQYGIVYGVDGDILFRTKIRRTYNTDGITENGYYGRFLGESYYTGSIGKKDVISTLKFDKILDYVDTDLVFKSDENLQKAEENTLWSLTNSKELKEEGLVKEDLFNIDSRLLNPLGIAYDTYKKETITVEDGTTEVVEKPLTTNLVLSVNDRIKDPDEYTSNDPTINIDISKFLLPNQDGKLILKANKVNASETVSEDMNYENIAEVVQFTTLTGRRTNYATTIGNANLNPIPTDKSDPDYEDIPTGTSKEYHESTKESDTSAVEEIILTIPTGLSKVDRIVRDTVEKTSISIGIIVIAVALVFIGMITGRFITKKIRKRRIK